MHNELLLIASLVVIFLMTLVWFAIFGDKGLVAWTVIATIAANIEVLIAIKAFGMDQTLGNVMFASTCLVTDILNEVSGKKQAKKAVNIGILTSLSFILISQSWLLFTPSSQDTMFSSITEIFSNTPRMMLAGLFVYAVTQRFDVWIYHKIWGITSKRSGAARPYLWVRKNGSTLLSQLLNTLLFTLLAFWGTFDTDTLVSIVISSYIIFIFTTLLDTPFVYLARKMREKSFLNCGEQ